MNKRNALTTAALSITLAIGAATASVAMSAPDTSISSSTIRSVAERAEHVEDQRPGAGTSKTASGVTPDCNDQSVLDVTARELLKCGFETAGAALDVVDNTYDQARRNVTVVSSTVKNTGRVVGTYAREVAAQATAQAVENVNEAVDTATDSAVCTVAVAGNALDATVNQVVSCA